MGKKSKPISGLRAGIIVPNSGKCYTDSEKHFIIQEYLKAGCTKVEIWQKHTGHTEEHGQILRWMRKLGYETAIKKRRPNFVRNSQFMAKEKSTKELTIGSDEFEILQLKNRVAALEKSLKDAEIKAIAYSTMVDIAEKEFNIPIRKKYNTKS